jgi:hypothetical protein
MRKEGGGGSTHKIGTMIWSTEVDRVNFGGDFFFVDSPSSCKSLKSCNLFRGDFREDTKTVTF